MIVPRWEWRTFGERFGAAEDRLAELTPTSVDDSDELYIVSSRGEASIKVRGGVLDVKRLEQVSDEGLEQWRPVAKAEFPIAATDVAELLLALDVAVSAARSRRLRPRRARRRGRASERRPPLGLGAQATHPLHARWLHGGADRCAGGLAGDTHDRRGDRGSRARPRGGRGARAVVAPERELPAGAQGARRVRGTPVRGRRRRHELGEVPPRGAVGGRRLAAAGRPRRGDPARRRARGVGPCSSRSRWPERSTRSPRWRTKQSDTGPRRSPRSAPPGCGRRPTAPSFVEAVQARCGVRVEVISGEEEARLAFLAATSGIERVDGSLVVFETGGGSTQFTFGHDERIEEQFSVPVGAVRITEQFGLDGVVDAAVLATALDAIAADLASLDGRPTPATLVAMGGAVTNLAAVKHELVTYDPEIVQGSELDLDELDRLIELFRSRSAEERRDDRRPPAQAGRGHPRRRLHRPDGVGEARPRVAHGERSRPAASAARRAVRLPEPAALTQSS